MITNKIIFVFLCILLLSCSNSNKLNVKYCSDFNFALIDSLDNSKIDFLIHNRQKFLLYVTDGSCSECIASFIDFVKKKRDIDIPCVYIVNTPDFTLFDYYVTKHELAEFMVDDVIIRSATDLFHRMESDFFAGNQLLLFFGEKDNQIISLPLDPFKYATQEFVDTINMIEYK